jgi:hypothetical protein
MYVPGDGNQPSERGRQPHRPDRGQIARYRNPADCLLRGQLLVIGSSKDETGAKHTGSEHRC